MVFYGTNSKVKRLCWVSQSIKAETNGNGVKYCVNMRDGKNIGSTKNVKRRQKTIKSEKVGKGATFFSKFPI